MRILNYAVTVLTVFILAAASFGGTYSGGTGNPASPYQIGNVSDWQELMTTTADWDKEFILIADINLQGVTLTPVGTSANVFAGVFDGNRHVISNAVINEPGTNYIGLFGYASGGQISNLGVENVNITGWQYVGGLVGNNYSTLTSCYATGSVSGDRVGGLVGYNHEAILASCYAACSVTGPQYIGGLVGGSTGTLTSCYATGSVSGNYDVGGLVGWNYNNPLIFCYATGSVSGTDRIGGLVGNNGGDIITLTSCYWDTQTSGQATSPDGGIGLSTATMQDSDTYLRAFWDFKGEIKNGTDDIWAMPLGGGYPVLAWQLPDSPVSNDEMSTAVAVTAGSPLLGTSTSATGLDITQNGYADSVDVWYSFDCTATGKYTVTVEPTSFDSTVGIFDEAQTEIVFNDDFFGGKSVVILRGEAGQRYYVRVSGHNGQTGDFTLTVEQGAVQAIQGDLNYDGMVNLVDFAIFSTQWLED